MSITSIPLYATILAMATTFFALSLLVQVIQELYKYLTSSQSRAYRGTLIDFLGPHAEQLFRPGAIPDLQVRGPFQFLRRRPEGHLQPMDKDDLVIALERTAAPWIQRAISALRLEASLQNGKSANPTPSFRALLSQVEGTEPGSPGHATALDLKDFLESWKVSANSSFDARAVQQALRLRFLPSVVRAEESFTQLTKNFDHAYRRRNLRQTFTFGFLLAFVAEQPFDRVYQAARQVPLDQAVAAAQQVRAIYESEATRDTSVVRTPKELAPLTDSLRMFLARPDSTLVQKDSTAGVPYRILAKRLGAHAISPLYLFGCLLTAILISFGAPLWNDITGAVLRLYKGPPRQEPREVSTTGDSDR